MDCPLCASQNTQTVWTDEKRSWPYWQCQSCQFLYRDASTWLSPEEEKSRYATHNNSIENKGYVRFLTPAVETLSPLLKPGQKGLDYGSGPGPILKTLFAAHGVEVKNYDPYFASEPMPETSAPYDFITCTEVFEHFYHPGAELEKLVSWLKPQGYLLIMTQLQPEIGALPQWGYRMDNTHVGFLHRETLPWISQHWGLEWVPQEHERLFLWQKRP